MKLSGFLLFLTIVLSLYFLVNFYIFLRGVQALPVEGAYRNLFKIIFLFLVLAYPLARFLERWLPGPLESLLLHLGAYYLAAMVFAFFLVLSIDLIRLVMKLVPFLPTGIREFAGWFKSHSFLMVTAIVVGLTIAGAINARQPHVRQFSLSINKAVANPGSLRVVLASDIHLGTLIHNSRLERYIRLINSQKPDLILLAGDVFDEDISSLIEQNTAALLRQLDSRYGVFAIPGNHEYFSGINAAITYLKQAGITVLRDSVAVVADEIILIGRDDLTGNRFGRRRKPLAELMADVDRSKPILLMDHQPFHLEEAQLNGVDVQVSGHTHHGQIFPFNLITKRVYEVSWGYKRKGNTHIYVSCGLGTWGPPVRLGNRPEIVVLELNFARSGAEAGQ